MLRIAVVVAAAASDYDSQSGLLTPTVTTAMAATTRTHDLMSRPPTQYGLSCASLSANKSFVFVKLTEQALLAIEQYVQQVSPVLIACPPTNIFVISNAIVVMNQHLFV